MVTSFFGIVSGDHPGPDCNDFERVIDDRPKLWMISFSDKVQTCHSVDTDFLTVKFGKVQISPLKLGEIQIFYWNAKGFFLILSLFIQIFFLKYWFFWSFILILCQIIVAGLKVQSQKLLSEPAIYTANVCFFGWCFLTTSSSTTRLYRGGVPRLASGNCTCCHTRDSGETMTSVSEVTVSNQ